jgi:tRNA G46 methylase TrmB
VLSVSVVNSDFKMSLAEEVSPEALEEQQFEIFPADLCQPLLLSEIFGNDRPLEIDLGSGSGQFLVEAGRRYPERNFLGIERQLGRVRKTRRKACQLSLTNVRVLRVEIDYAVKYLLPAEAVSRFICHFRILGRNADTILAGWWMKNSSKRSRSR